MASLRLVAKDRVSLTLCAVFILAAAFYLWTAGTTVELDLSSAGKDPYNQLAHAFLHATLSVGKAPAALVHLANPYDSAQNVGFRVGLGIHDYVLYGGRLYLTWGPAPVLVLLVPLQLLGFAPSTSLIVAIFSIIGLGFALAVLRVLLRQLGLTTLWLAALAAGALALSTAVPFILRSPAVYEEAIAGGFCFAMGGIWLVTLALTQRKASTGQLALMSLCFGLAAGSRPTLGFASLLLIPVYMSLRSTQPRLRLASALAVPVAGCFVLLLAYNQVRFGNALEFGVKYQLAGFNSLAVHFNEPSYVLPGVWYYIFYPPRLTFFFPFLALGPPPVVYPFGLPANYTTPELTGGLLPMTPIVIFLLALPWLWRRRPSRLNSLAVPFLLLAVAGAAAMLFVSYAFFATTERYEVDFSPLFLLGALAAWLALAVELRGLSRRMIRVAGGLLVAWGCFTGLAISFTGYANSLAVEHPAAWNTLGDIGSPISTMIARVAGRPLLAQVSGPNFAPLSPVDYGSLGLGPVMFWLSAGERARLTVVSPDNREAALAVSLTSGEALGTGGSLHAVFRGPGATRHVYPVPAGGTSIRIPVKLRRGVNRLEVSPRASVVNPTSPAVPTSSELLDIMSLSLADHG